MVAPHWAVVDCVSLGLSIELAYLFLTGVSGINLDALVFQLWR